MIILLTIEEYIKKRKSKDRLNEFDQDKKPQNLTLCINYVLEYFNDYLNVSKIELQAHRHREKMAKYKKEIQHFNKEGQEFLLKIYDNHETKLNITLNNYLKGLDYFLLCYKENEFKEITKNFCKEKLSRFLEEQFQQENICKLVKYFYKAKSEFDEESRHDVAVIHPIFPHISGWVQTTFEKYSVNLSSFTHDYTLSFTDSLPWIRGKGWDYDYKNTNNPFDINYLYENIKDRPFIKGHKKDLEILLMYHWLHGLVKDDDNYWSEYINKVKVVIKNV